MPADYLIDDIAQYRRETWRWQVLMGLRRTPAARSVSRHSGPEYRRWVRNLWRHRALTHRRRAHRPPHYAAWQCIHRHEGAWNDPNAPYYGGLQMDIGFQRAYGARPASPQGHGGQLDARRADVGRRARVPVRPRLLSVAQHRAVLPPDLSK